MTALQTAIQRAQAGDASVVPQLRALLDAHPELWKQAGDMAAHVESSLLMLVGGNDLFARETTRKKAAAIKAELADEHAPPLEKLLAERIGLCWIALHAAELDVIAARDHRLPTAGDQARKRLDSAQRRYLAAIKQQAVVRKLLRPALSPLQLAGARVAESPKVQRPSSRNRLSAQPLAVN
jgi:hypothetical protein